MVGRCITRQYARFALFLYATPALQIRLNRARSSSQPTPAPVRDCRHTSHGCYPRNERAFTSYIDKLTAAKGYSMRCRARHLGVTLSSLLLAVPLALGFTVLTAPVASAHPGVPVLRTFDDLALGTNLLARKSVV